MPKQVDNPNSKSSLRLPQAAFSLFGKLYHAPHFCARQSYNICEAVACACCRTYQIQFDEHLCDISHGINWHGASRGPSATGLLYAWGNCPLPLFAPSHATGLSLESQTQWMLHPFWHAAFYANKYDTAAICPVLVPTSRLGTKLWRRRMPTANVICSRTWTETANAHEHNVASRATGLWQTDGRTDTYRPTTEQLKKKRSTPTILSQCADATEAAYLIRSLLDGRRLSKLQNRVTPISGSLIWLENEIISVADKLLASSTQAASPSSFIAARTSSQGWKTLFFSFFSLGFKIFRGFVGS